MGRLRRSTLDNTRSSTNLLVVLKGRTSALNRIVKHYLAHDFSITPALIATKQTDAIWFLFSVLSFAKKELDILFVVCTKKTSVGESLHHILQMSLNLDDYNIIPILLSSCRRLLGRRNEHIYPVRTASNTLSMASALPPHINHICTVAGSSLTSRIKYFGKFHPKDIRKQ